MDARKLNPNLFISDVAGLILRWIEGQPQNESAVIRKASTIYQANSRGGRVQEIKLKIAEMAQANPISLKNVIIELLKKPEGGLKSNSFNTFLLRHLMRQIPEIDADVEMTQDQMKLLLNEVIDPTRLHYATFTETLLSTIRALKKEIDEINQEKDKGLHVLLGLRRKIEESENKIKEDSATVLELIEEIRQYTEEELILLEEIREEENNFIALQERNKLVLQNVEEKDRELLQVRNLLSAFAPELNELTFEEFKSIPPENLREAMAIAQEALQSWIIYKAIDQKNKIIAEKLKMLQEKGKQQTLSPEEQARLDELIAKERMKKGKPIEKKQASAKYDEAASQQQKSNELRDMKQVRKTIDLTAVRKMLLEKCKIQSSLIKAADLSQKGCHVSVVEPELLSQVNPETDYSPEEKPKKKPVTLPRSTASSLSFQEALAQNSLFNQAKKSYFTEKLITQVDGEKQSSGITMSSGS